MHDIKLTLLLLFLLLSSGVGVGKLAERKRGVRVGVYADCLDRLTQCARILLDPSLREKQRDVFLQSCHVAFNDLVVKQKQLKTKAGML